MKAIRKGDKGKQVEAWQYFLIGRGYTNIVADGEFGPNTYKATLAFQNSAGIPADGVVGNTTYTAAMKMGFLLVNDPKDNSSTGLNWPKIPSFKPLTASQMQSRFGKIEFRINPDGNSVTILNDWKSKNIVTLDMPFLKNTGPYFTSKISVHKDAADKFQKLFRAWEEKGLLHLIKSYDGAFNPRLIRGSNTTLSTHAFGIAIDINVRWNGLGSVPARKGQEGSVRELVPIANKLGFFWGGHFTRKDGMHFELAKTP